MSDYTDRVRAFAQLNPDLYVPDTSDPVVFQAVARTVEADQAFSERVMYDLTLGENLRDVLRSPSDHKIPDRQRYAASRTAAVTGRVRAAQRAAAVGGLENGQRRWDVPPDPQLNPTDGRQEAFARLNPDFGVLPDSHDPQQHRFAQQRERALALGQRVVAAEQSGRERGESSDIFYIPRRLAREQPQAEPVRQQGVER
jgi:hypothetical protein